MDLSGQASQARFASYVENLVEVIGHTDRAEPLNGYCVGLLMPGERKSVEPMAAIVAPARVSAKHQSLLHLVGQAPWPDEAVLQKIRVPVIDAILEADKTAPPKQRHTAKPIFERLRIEHGFAGGYTIGSRVFLRDEAARAGSSIRVEGGRVA